MRTSTIRVLVPAILMGVLAASPAQACYRISVEESLFHWPLNSFLLVVALPAWGILGLVRLAAGPKRYAVVHRAVALLANGLLLAMLDLLAFLYALERTDLGVFLRRSGVETLIGWACLIFVLVAPIGVAVRLWEAGGAVGFLFRQLRWSTVVPAFWGFAVLLDSEHGIWDFPRTIGLAIFLSVFAWMTVSLPEPLRARFSPAGTPAPDPALSGLIAASVESAGGSCPVCRGDLGHEEQVSCDGCETPHHRACWSYLDRCAVFGCATPTSRTSRC